MIVLRVALLAVPSKAGVLQMDLGISSTALPDESFLHRGLLPTPGASNPLHSSDGRTLADAPGLMPRPGEILHASSLPCSIVSCRQSWAVWDRWT